MINYIKDRCLVAIALAVAAIIATGCSGGEPVSPPEPPVVPPTPEVPRYELSFMPRGGDPSTASRADAALESVYKSFGVWAWKRDGADHYQPVMMRSDMTTPYVVNYPDATTRWTYDVAPQSLRYWDGSAHTYKFSAFSPCVLGSDYAMTATADGSLRVNTSAGNVVTLRTRGSHPGSMAITGITGNSTSATDWLVASHLRHIQGTRTLQDEDSLSLDSSKRFTALSTFHDDVALRFHHILSAIEFRVYTGEGTPRTVTALKATISTGAITAADYAGDADSQSVIAGNWTYPASPTRDATLIDWSGSVTAPEGKTNAALVGARTPEIPQFFGPDTELNGSIDIEFTLTVDGKEVTASGTLTGGWQPDRLYIYYLRLSGTEYIYVDLSPEDFEWGDYEEWVIPSW